MNDRARGCLAGLCVGDALGSQYEFMHPFALDLMDDYELSKMVGSKIFNTVPGQITDDSEMALCLVKSLLDNNCYDKEYTKSLYVDWALSKPIDIGITTRNALYYDLLNPKSESNGSLMRVAPLGIWGAKRSTNLLIDAIKQDVSVTHSNKKVEDCSILFTLAIAIMINKPDIDNTDLINLVKFIADIDRVDVSLLDQSVDRPKDYYNNMGHVEIAFLNAFYHLRVGSSVRYAILDTIRQGGDTDTNAAICGALLGARYGIENIPQGWLTTVINCTSSRPLKYQTKNILQLADQLLTNF